MLNITGNPQTLGIHSKVRSKFDYFLQHLTDISIGLYIMVYISVVCLLYIFDLLAGALVVNVTARAYHLSDNRKLGCFSGNYAISNIVTISRTYLLTQNDLFQLSPF